MDKKIGFYAGVFDILHAGHILAMKEAKKYCSHLIVGLHCCPNYKHPVQTIYERYIQLASCKYVDEVVPYYDKDDCATLIKSLPFDIYFLGDDHKGKPWENDEIVKDMGKQIIYLPRKHSLSSSYVKERINKELKW